MSSQTMLATQCPKTTAGSDAMPLCGAGTQSDETASQRTVNVSQKLILLEDQSDCCPHCRIPLEIVSVKFKLSGGAIICSCPNCAIAADWPAAKWGTLNELKKIRARCFGLLRPVVSVMDPRSSRFRYFVAILFVTLITAGVLRHVFHVYGGFSREEIRAGALMAIPALALAIMFFQRKPSTLNNGSKRLDRAARTTARDKS
jgi:hypothetical protein